MQKEVKTAVEGTIPKERHMYKRQKLTLKISFGLSYLGIVMFYSFCTQAFLFL